MTFSNPAIAPLITRNRNTCCRTLTVARDMQIFLLTGDKNKFGQPRHAINQSKLYLGKEPDKVEISLMCENGGNGEIYIKVTFPNHL